MSQTLCPAISTSDHLLCTVANLRGLTALQGPWNHRVPYNLRFDMLLFLLCVCPGGRH
jgi:hypothetical protein